MALTQEQIANLMRGVTLPKRATMAGVPAANVPERRMLEHIDSQSFRNTLPERSKPGEIVNDANGNRVGEIDAEGHLVVDSIETEQPIGFSFDGAPSTRAESGLISNLTFDESQINAFRILTRGKDADGFGGHSSLIGAAGTGKTTMVKQALGYLIYGDGKLGIPAMGIRRLPGDQGPSIAVCAFTGIATQVVRAMLPEWLHPAVKTIHSLLEYKPVNANGDMDGEKRGMFVPTRTATNKFDYDIIVIDEASMLGLDLWHNVIDAARPHTIFILIGDLNQLKPVADATFFAYALSAGLDKKHGWDIAELTTIHRQKEAAANKIIDAAHAILNGKQPVFDNPQTDPNWRCIGFELPPKANEAHNVIVNAINYLRAQPTPELDGENPDGTPKFRMDSNRVIFDPYKDLLLCAGNGYDENDSASFVQQSPLNGTLSRLIEKPSEEHPIFYIDAGRETRKFAVGHRVMATKNESPAQKDRVTNGLTGRIIGIESNSNWHGNKAMFGTEKEVLAFRQEKVKNFMNQQNAGSNAGALAGVDFTAFSLASVDTSQMDATPANDEKQASHVVSVKYANGAERTYRTAADVGSIQLAYAITVHKAQGSQADTVIIVCHHAVKKQLNREWFYTGVTRARRRVVILYTRMGISVACSRQQIFGASLREKVNRYRQVMNAGNVFVRLEARRNVLEGVVDRIDESEGETFVVDRDDVEDVGDVF